MRTGNPIVIPVPPYFHCFDFRTEGKKKRKKGGKRKGRKVGKGKEKEGRKSFGAEQTKR